MKYVIHTLNVTSMTAHKPNDFFKRPKFRMLFSLKLHLITQQKTVQRSAPIAMKASGHTSGKNS